MSNAQDEALDTMVNDLGIDTEKLAREELLDLNTMGKQAIADLQNYRTIRTDMIKRRDALKRALKIMDKRIEIVLSTIKTLQTPT